MRVGKASRPITPPPWANAVGPEDIGKSPIIGVPEDVVAIPVPPAMPPPMAPKMLPRMLLSGATTAMR